MRRGCRLTSPEGRGLWVPAQGRGDPRVFVAELPARRIIVDVATNTVQRGFVADDVARGHEGRPLWSPLCVAELVGQARGRTRPPLQDGLGGDDGHLAIARKTRFGYRHER